MSSVSLVASERSQTGKSVARKIVAVATTFLFIYSNGEPASLIIIDSFELKKHLSALAIRTRSSISKPRANIQLLGERGSTTSRIWCNPSCGLHKISNDVEVTVDVLVKTVGRAVGTTLGGKLRLICRTLTVSCLPANIPATVDVDVTNLDIGQFLKVDAIANPEGAPHFTTSPAYNVVTVIKSGT